MEDGHNDAYISTPEKSSVHSLPFLGLDFDLLKHAQEIYPSP